MPKRSYLQTNALCPFYKSDDGEGRIVCEGIADASYVAAEFKDRNDFIEYIRQYCCKNYTKCSLYTQLMEKYPDANSQ